MRTAYELADWQGYLTRAEIDLLKELACQLPSNPVIVNLGAGAGTSTFAFLEARPDAVVFSVDILLTESETTTNEHLRLKEAPVEIAARCIKVWGDSKQVGVAWPFPVDLVFIDGDHSYEGCKGDILAWHETTRWMAFHDYGSPHWPGVAVAVDESMQILWQEAGHVDTIKAFRRG